MNYLRIFLLVLIIAGLGLLVTQKLWVPTFVQWVVANDDVPSAWVLPGRHATSSSSMKTDTSKAEAAPTGTEGTLNGLVTLSPTCPVETDPPSANCGLKGYSTQIRVLKANSTTLVASTQSDANGTFNISLPAGSYTLVAGDGNVLPRCTPVNAGILSGSTTSATISCDSGIR